MRPTSHRRCNPAQQYIDEIKDLAQQIQGQEELVTDTVGGGAMNIRNWQLRIEEAAGAYTTGMGAVDMLQKIGASHSGAVMPNVKAHGQASVIFPSNKV